jgi:hypothetical protein
MQMSALEGCRAAMRLMWEFMAQRVIESTGRLGEPPIHLSM